MSTTLNRFASTPKHLRWAPLANVLWASVFWLGDVIVDYMQENKALVVVILAAGGPLIIIAVIASIAAWVKP